MGLARNYLFYIQQHRRIPAHKWLIFTVVVGCPGGRFPSSFVFANILGFTLILEMLLNKRNMGV